MDNQSLSSAPPILSEQPPTIPDAQKPKFNLLLLLLAVIIFSIIGAGSFYLGKISNKQNLTANPTITSITQAPPSPTPDPTANWKTYSNFGIAFKYPSEWLLTKDGSSFIEIKEPNRFYLLTLSKEPNMNQNSGRPFKDLYEFLKIPYLKTFLVDGQQAQQTLPRAGSENISGVLFFSKDSESIYGLNLETPRDGSKIDEGKKIFDQILSTFKFLDQSISCDVKDKEFCNFLNIVYPLVLSSNFSELLNYQDLTDITCEQTNTESPPPPPICDGAKKNEVRKGYVIGTNLSEGSINNKEMAVSVLQNYIHRYQLVWEYRGSVVDQTKGVMVFLNPKKDSLFVLELKKEKEEWRIKDIIIGIASNDYLTLDDKILTYFP